MHKTPISSWKEPNKPWKSSSEAWRALNRPFHRICSHNYNHTNPSSCDRVPLLFFDKMFMKVVCNWNRLKLDGVFRRLNRSNSSIVRRIEAAQSRFTCASLLTQKYTQTPESSWLDFHKHHISCVSAPANGLQINLFVSNVINGAQHR